MTNRTDDDRFDAWVPGAARDYNRPSGPAPREAMWAAIEGSLDAAPRSGTREGAGTAPVVATPASTPLVTPLPTQARGRRRVSLVWWQAAAAVLLLAAGIGIGRVWSGRAPAGAGITASTDADGAGSDGDSARASGVAAEGDAARLASAGASSSMPAAGARDGAARRDADLPGAPAGGDRGRSYEVASLQHLSRAEALLTAFRAGNGAADGVSMDRWARDLLADTRLFIDSPAASDARRRQLLLDLELVLAQIVQLPAESSADRGLVQRSIERGAVLSRLRSTIPAGYSSGT